MRTLIKNASIVNEGKIKHGDVLINHDIIEEINSSISLKSNDTQIIDAEGNYLIPGFIDDQVHFREPGLTHKETIKTGSKAAIAGGITSFIEMPNTKPQTTNFKELDNKFAIAAKESYANYSFMFGGTNDNLELIKQINPKEVAGLKLFLGSSTGNMLVDDERVLESIFRESPVIISTHCEDESTIKKNLERYVSEYGDDIPIEKHPKIRSEEACYLSSSSAVALAKKTNARLHVFHISTAKELTLFNNNIPLKDKQITAEVCLHHLWFSDKDYAEHGSKIKWNPAVKKASDREAILQAFNNNIIDIFATDHAPHTPEEKSQVYTTCPSGGPMVQHALPALFQMTKNKETTLENVVQKACHNPAILFDIEKRGFIKEGYKADLVIVDPALPFTVTKDNLFYKCGWSPMMGKTFNSRVLSTFVNGRLAYHNFQFKGFKAGEKLNFDR
ncbi:MAG: dihydroorotase [Psychroflexus sp.]|jgi:dihydroorotase|nr:dihydroorotase [Psychroflexus sp.]MDR9447629.1 dihydroorotase [Psychroflexus sp.]